MSSQGISIVEKHNKFRLVFFLSWVPSPPNFHMSVQSASGRMCDSMRSLSFPYYIVLSLPEAGGTAEGARLHLYKNGGGKDGVWGLWG